MKSKRIHPWGVLLALGLIASAAPLHAIQFRLLGWTSADVNLQCVINNKPVELSVFTDDFSPVYEFKGEGPLVLYKMMEHEGKPQKQIACTVTIPPGMEQGVLLLIPGDDTKAVYRKVIPNHFGFVVDTAPLIYDYVWLDDSVEVRPVGTIEFRNLSQLPVALQIEQRQLTLAPKAKAQVPLLEGAKRMAFRAAAQLSGQWKVFATNPLPTRGPERMMVIIRDGPAAMQGVLEPGEPNIRMISLFDWPPPPKPVPEVPVPPTLASSR
jgi:hypothetical protein